MTSDGGKTWTIISPDLTTNQKSHEQISGGLTPDNIGVEYANVIYAIAESPAQAGLIWVGTDDGLVQVTRDGGKHWSNVTANIPGLPPDGTVSNIDPSSNDPGTAYVSVDFHQVNNRDPFVYETNDYGATWRSISSDLPRSVFSYVHCVIADPARKGLLYLGTENGVYVSFDDGGHWQSLQSNLPHAPAYWLTVQPQFHDLVVATYGRGIWILDDITPLEQYTAAVSSAAVHLFPPRPAYRFLPVMGSLTVAGPADGSNPPYGASIDYWLNAAPSGDVNIAILDAKGQTVASLRGSKQAGLNRVWWNLRGVGTPEPKLRSEPEGDPEFPMEANGLRPYVTWTYPYQPEIRVLQPPGRYTVKLDAGGQSDQQPLTIVKDPHSAGTEADIELQDEMLAQMREDVASLVKTVDEIESMRLQLEGLYGKPSAISSSAVPDVVAGRKELVGKLLAVENQLINVKYTGASLDAARYPVQLYAKLLRLGGAIASSDMPPTGPEREVYNDLKKRLSAAQSQYDGLVKNDLPVFNRVLARNNLPALQAGSDF
jgi:photosystem II stability/assembly factor-like uncharacterized protein